jgi:hypothetical protein
MNYSGEPKIGDTVAINCNIVGHLRGKVTHFLLCINKGPEQALVRVTLPNGEQADYTEKVSRLIRL